MIISENEKILNTIAGLKNGDTVRIRVAGDEMHEGWEDCFLVCGVSDHYILAFHDDEYTIINKLPTEYQHNGIPKGACVCAPDNLIFGYTGGYHFTDPTWVKQYLEDLETGTIEPSLRRRARITKVERMGTRKRANEKPCLTCTRVKDPKNCENKSCQDWREWFIQRWEKMRNGK